MSGGIMGFVDTLKYLDFANLTPQERAKLKGEFEKKRKALQLALRSYTRGLAELKKKPKKAKKKR
jgi:hypothetical protein